MTNYVVWNATDRIMASPEEFRSKGAAMRFCKAFKERFREQGYYLTFRRERIPIEEVMLEVREV
jgi:hypothetical protein